MLTAPCLSPFSCCLGYQPPLFPEKERDVDVIAAQLLVRHAQQARKRARVTLLKNVNEMKSYADRRRCPAPKYFSIRDIPLMTVCHKLAPRLSGPYTITRLLTRSAVRLSLSPPHSSCFLCFPPQTLCCIPFYSSSQTPTFPPPAHRWRSCPHRVPPALVAWEGYRLEENSWVPERDILFSVIF